MSAPRIDHLDRLPFYEPPGHSGTRNRRLTDRDFCPGFELVMAADVLLAGEKAKFGQPEILIGFFAPVGVAYLPKLVGTAKAMEITCSGRTYSGEEMRASGLVTKVVPSESLVEEMEGYLKDFRKVSPLVLRMNVRMLKRLRVELAA